MTTLNLVLAVWNYLRGSYEKLNNRTKEKGRDVVAPQPFESSTTHTTE